MYCTFVNIYTYQQDMTFIYSRVCRDAVNFGIAFDKADAENGALEVAPGLEVSTQVTTCCAFRCTRTGRRELT